MYCYQQCGNLRIMHCTSRTRVLGSMRVPSYPGLLGDLPPAFPEQMNNPIVRETHALATTRSLHLTKHTYNKVREAINTAG